MASLVTTTVAGTLTTTSNSLPQVTIASASGNNNAILRLTPTGTGRAYIQHGSSNIINFDGDDITIAGHVTPASNISYNLGSSGARWLNIYGSVGNFSGEIDVDDGIDWNANPTRIKGRLGWGSGFVYIGSVAANGITKIVSGNGVAALTLAANQSAAFSSTVTWSGGGSANANTAYTYSQVGHLPLAGGTLTGTLTSRKIAPSADSTYDLGENTVRYANIFGDTAYLGNADGTGLLLGVAAFGGAGNQRLQIGATLAGSSSATAQIAGLTRVGYIITHNTTEGIRPNADGQSTCGTSVQRWSTVYGQAANFNGALTAGSGTFAGSVTPSVDSTYDLGGNTNRWTNIFGDNIYGSGANLTSLNASALGSGTVPTARLGTGTADSSTFLRGDNTWVANASGTVTSVTAGTGMTQTGTSTVNPTLNVIGGTGITANANDIALTNTAVSAGSYTYASITVDAQGRLTAASSGSAPLLLTGGTLTGLLTSRKIAPSADSTYDLGENTARYANLFVDSITCTAASTFGGAVTASLGLNIANNQRLSIGTAGSNTGYIRFYNNNSTAYYLDWESTAARAYRYHGTSSGSAYVTTFSQAGTGGHNVTVSGALTAASSVTLSSGSALNASALTTTTCKLIGVKLSYTGGSNTANDIIGGISMGNSGEEYAGIYAIDGGSSAQTDLALFTGSNTNGIKVGLKIEGLYGHITAPGGYISTGVSGTALNLGDDSRVLSVGYGNEIWNNNDDNSAQTLHINHRGYAGGTTQFRSLKVRNGKGADIALFDGTDKSTTFSGNVNITTTWTTQLTLQGTGTDYINAGVVLKATNGTSVRGLGVFMHDAGGDTEWYAGTPYASSDRYIIARKGSQASHSTAVAVTGNALLTVDNSGSLTVGSFSTNSSGDISCRDVSPRDIIDADDISCSTAYIGGSGAPQTALQVGDYTDAAETITIATSQNGTGRINFYDNNNTEGGSLRVVGETSGCKMHFANRWNTDADKVTFDLVNGRVGIGTASPAGTLHVYDNYAGERNHYFDNYNASGITQVNIRAGTGNEYLSLSRSTTLAALWVAGDPFIIKHYHSSAWHDSIVVSSTGDIGMGTDSPNESSFSGDCNVLSIQGSATDGFGALELRTPNVTSTNRLGEIRFVNLDGTSSTPTAYAGIRSRRDGADNKADLSFWTGATTGGIAEHVTITSGGSVGIGSTAPTSQLNVYAALNQQFHHYTSGSYTAILALGRAKGGTSLLEIKYDSAGAENAYISRAYPNATLHFDKQGTDHMVIDQNGKVGIGSQSPDTALFIRGTFDASANYGSTNCNKGITLSSTGNGANYGDGYQWGLVFAGGNNSSATNDYPVAAVMARGDGVSSYVGGELSFQTKTESQSDLKQRMVVTKGGDVGIGTDSPSRLLDVYNGTARIYQTTANSELLIGCGGTGTAGLVLDASNGDGAGSDYFYITQNNDLTVDIATPSSGGVVKLSSKGSLTQTLDGTKTTFNGNVVLGNIQSSINPLTDSTYDIGSNTGRWANVFADTLYGAGSNITSLNGSNISSGTVAAARLGSGSSITSKFLRGDNTWQTVSSGSGTVTSIGITPGTGLDVSNSPITSSGNITVSLDLSEFTDMTADITTTDEVILLDGGAERRKAFGELKLSKFNNDSGWTSNSGTVTSIATGTGLDGGTITSSGTITLDLSEFTDMTADITTTDEVILLDSGSERRKAFGELKLSKFNNDSGWTSNAGDMSTDDYAQFQNLKSPGSSSGGLTQDTWVKRTLQTTQTNTITNASLGSSVITLPAGTYYCRFWASAYYCGAHQARLRDTTSSVTRLYGSSELAWVASPYPASHSVGEGMFTLAGLSTLELQHICGTTSSTLGQGRRVGSTSSGDVNTGYLQKELYCAIEFWKV